MSLRTISVRFPDLNGINRSIGLRSPNLDRKVVTIFILAALVCAEFVFSMTRCRAKASLGRFVLIGNGSIWERDANSPDYFNLAGWNSLSITGASLAFDTTTGKICLTNAYPELFGSNGARQVVLVVGPGGKPEPLADIESGQAKTRGLPVCSDLAAH
jgi:hypothetical protein